MSWRDELRRVVIGGRRLVGAEFRGVPFFVDTAERSGGRRTISHEFPLRDKPFIEDLGRKARTFRVDGYVIGDDYLAQRDDLLAALEAGGAGILVLPSYGILRAVCSSLSVRETKADGGMAVFSLEFAEAPDQAIEPSASDDSAGRVALRADAAVAASSAELTSSYSTTGLPAFAIASSEAALTRAADALSVSLAPIARTAQELAEINGAVVLLKAQAASLVRSPADLIERFVVAINVLAETARETPGAMLAALLDAFDVDLTTPTSSVTATRRREAANQAALIGSLRRTLVIEAARIAPLVEFNSLDEALAARARIGAALDAQAEVAGDAAYPELVSLRSEVLRAVPGGREFARVVDISRFEPIPAAVLAYQLYGSTSRDAEIVGRNPDIKHPGVAYGSMKVLSDA